MYGKKIIKKYKKIKKIQKLYLLEDLKMPQEFYTLLNQLSTLP